MKSFHVIIRYFFFLSDECPGGQVLVCMVLHLAFFCGTNTQLCTVFYHLVPKECPIPPSFHSPEYHMVVLVRAAWVTVAFVCVSCWLAVLTSSACILSSLVKSLIEIFYLYSVGFVCLFSLPLNLQNSLHIWAQVLCQMYNLCIKKSVASLCILLIDYCSSEF